MASATAETALTGEIPAQTGAKISSIETTAWLTPPRFAILLALLVMAAFPDVIFGAKTFFFRDYSMFGYPLAHYHREAFWRGEIPLWNPLNNCGIPYVAQWNTMVFYPPSLIYILLPMPWSLGWFCLVHLFLAGLGMHCLAYRWTNNRLAASLAGIAFAFNGLTLSCLIWPNNIAALVWMPCVWLLVERSWTSSGVDLLKASLVGTIQMLSGAPEVILFTWVLIGLTWGCHFASEPGLRQKLLLHFPIVPLLVSGLSAIQLLPFLDLLFHSQRSASTAGSYWGMPGWGWANFFVPLLRGTQTSTGVFLQPGQGWASSYYLGIGVLVLALVAVWKIRRPIVAGLGLALGLTVVLALGKEGHLYSWLLMVFPAAGFMRFPIKLVVVCASAVPLLAAFALAAWQQSRDGHKRELRLTFVAVVLMSLLAIAAILLFSARFPAEAESSTVTMWNGLSRAGLLLGIACLVFAIGRPLSSKWRLITQAGLLGIVWLDLISHAPNQNPTVDARAYETALPTFAEMQPRPKAGESRVSVSFRSNEKFHTTIMSNAFESVLGVRMGLFDNCNLLEGIPKADGFYSLYIPEQQDVRFSLYRSTNDVREGLADFVGVSQLSSDTRTLEWEPRKTWMPLLTTGQRPEFAGGKQTMEALRSSSFNPREVVYLPESARKFVTVTNSTRASIVGEKISNHRIQADIETEGPTLLVVAQTYFHKWKARVDGKPVNLLRANHAFQAVEVPAGRHAVELAYEDRSFQSGAAISGLTLFGCLGFALRKRAKERNETTQPSGVAPQRG